MTLQITLLVVLTVGAVWKSIHLVRAPHDRLLRFLVACLSLLAAGHALSLPSVTRLVDAATTSGVAKVVYNGLVMTGLYALVCFFVYATRDGEATHPRRIWIHRVLLVITLATMITLMIMTPAGLRGHSLTTPHIIRPEIAWFYIVGNIYFVYAYLSGGWWAWRYSAPASRYLSLALRVTALGLVGLMITSIDRAIWVVLRFNHGPPLERLNAINWRISNGSFILLTIGICLLAVVQAVAAMRSWLLHRRLYRQLTPLWAALHQAYPELILHREPAGRRLEPFRFNRTHRNFYRRLIECRDGLVRLSPYIAVVAEGQDISHCSTSELARYIRAALALKPQQEAPNSGFSAVAVALPAANDINSDVRELVAVSNALSERPS